MSWDDYRYVLAVADEGSVRGAAKTLQVNASTVTRRLEAVEGRLGVVLFARTGRSLRFTPQGREIVERLRLLQGQIRDIELDLQGSDERMGGVVRVAVADAIAEQVLLPRLSDFFVRFPDIQVDIETQADVADLTSASMDVVIAATPNPPDEMIARPLGQLPIGAYVHRDLLESTRPEDLGWIDWRGDLPIAQFCRGLREEYFAGAQVRLRCDQVSMQVHAIRGCIGAGIVPAPLAQQHSELIALSQMPQQMGPTLWLISHPDFRTARRIQEFTRFVRELFADVQESRIAEELQTIATRTN